MRRWVEGMRPADGAVGAKALDGNKLHVQGQRRSTWLERNEKGEQCCGMQRQEGARERGGKSGFDSQWLTYQRPLSGAVMRSDGVFHSCCLV